MKHLTKLLLVFIFTIAITNVFATNVNTDPSPAGSNKIEFVKADGDDLIFNIDLQKIPAEGCVLMIKDLEGNVIFTESIKGAIHNKLYRINRQSMNGLNFEVRHKKFTFKESFNFKTNVQETFTVTKV